MAKQPVTKAQGFLHNLSECSPYVALVFFLCVMVYAGSLHLSLSTAHAQETVRNYTVVPPSVERSLSPGERTEGVMKIVNDSPDPVRFQADIRDFVVDDTEGTPNILPPNTLSNKFSAAAWIGVTPSTFTVQPDQRQEIHFYIQIPKDARPGGHYAAVVFTPSNISETPQSGAVVRTQIGSLFYLTVKGPIHENAVVSTFTTDNLQEYGPVKLFTRVTNLGDLHIKPTGYITVSNMFGKTVYTLPFAGKNIFPGKSRDVETAFGSHSMFGRYTALLSLKYGTNNALPLSASVSFWIIPWRMLTVVILILIALILGALVLLRKQKKHPKEEMETNQ